MEAVCSLLTGYGKYRRAKRAPAYIPRPVPTILIMNAVISPIFAPAHQPTQPPMVAPTNAASLVTLSAPG